MKNFIQFLAIVLTSCPFVSTAQTAGTITYTETIQLDFKLPDGMEIEGMDKSMSTDKELFFDKQLSIYKDVKNNHSSDKTMTSDDGSFQITFGMDETENIFHTDLKNKTTVHQTGFMGKEFIIESSFEKHQWKLTGEKIKYLDYVCQKAEKTVEENGKKIDVVAWFTSEIPVSVGPKNYNQLPGAILMISKNEGKIEIKATAITLGKQAKEIFELPKKGKKVSQEEYDQIVEEKTKEMHKEYGSDKDAIIIRG